MFMCKDEIRRGETDSSSLHLLHFQHAISRRHGSQFQKASAQVVHSRAKNFAGFILIPVLFPPFSRSKFSPDFFFRSQRFGNFGYFPPSARMLFCSLRGILYTSQIKAFSLEACRADAIFVKRTLRAVTQLCRTLNF